MITHPVALTLETYTTVLDKENLGEPHSTLAGAGAWYPPEAAHARDRRILAELHQQNLTHGTRISPQFAHTLELVQRPHLEYYTHHTTAAGERSTVRTATDGQHALLITSQGERIELTPIRVEQLSSGLAAALPATAPARVQSINAAMADLDALQAGKSLPTGPSTHAAKRMSTWLGAERHHVGQLFAAVRDRRGRRRATQAPMPCWIDTDHGRILLTPDGTGWCTLTPGDGTGIARALSTLEKKLHG